MTREITQNVDTGVVRIFVVRHGRTDWNAKKILQGHIDVDINEEGREQAEKLGQHFKTINLDLLISSDLSRCIDTAKFILAYQDNPVYYETPNLRERDMGKVQGMPLQSAIEKYGVNFRDFGENKEALITRVTEIWNIAIKIAKVNDRRNILLCTHGGVISLFINHLYDVLNYSLEDGISKEDLRVPYNTSISVIDISKNTGEGVIRRFGVTEHLGADFKVVNQLLR